LLQQTSAHGYFVCFGSLASSFGFFLQSASFLIFGLECLLLRECCGLRRLRLLLFL
jgi:hypothetical protein